MEWVLSSGCGSGLHCGECRGSREFRESLARSGRVRNVDFLCPYGVEVDLNEPTLRRKAGRLWSELQRWRAAGYRLSSQKEQERRLEICATCEYYAPRENFGLGKCRICGCTRGKLWLASAQCPHPDGARWAAW